MTGYFLEAAAPELHERLVGLATQRLVFFAGLPGTGKSLLVHQLAHLAARSRGVYLLQWDVARVPFEASAAGLAYPQVEGVTHPIIRRAVGLWARAAVAAWEDANDERTLLIGEVPLVGNRLVELVQGRDDAAESLLTSPACRFVLPVPSTEVRRYIEEERERRFVSPLSQREREDAPPLLLRDAWLEIVALGAQMGLTVEPEAAGTTPPYDASLYEAVYADLLRGRNMDVLSIDVVLTTRAMSVYDYGVECRPMTPLGEEAERYIREAERVGAASERLSVV